MIDPMFTPSPITQRVDLYIYIPLGIGIFNLLQIARVLFKYEIIHPFTISYNII